MFMFKYLSLQLRQLQIQFVSDITETIDRPAAVINKILDVSWNDN